MKNKISRRTDEPDVIALWRIGGGRRDVHGAPVGLIRVQVVLLVFSWQGQVVLCVRTWQESGSGDTRMDM
jgi:hypothetical protein